jgi:S-adenosylmethionine:tRNA ribosyltransferase-isomerase
MLISDFDYELPEDAIAQHPLERRDESKMLVLNRLDQSWSDKQFKDFPDLIREGDTLVVNNTKVFPARLIGKREPSGGQAEFFLVREVGKKTWEALARPARRLKLGQRVSFGDGNLKGEVIEELEEGRRIVRFECEGSLNEKFDALGQTPLPPYIKRPEGTLDQDRERYQTVFARLRGAIAAPTAGLHFTQAVLEEVKRRGAKIVEITLHVGYGTFEPVRVDKVDRHRVSPEWIEISEAAADTINETREKKGRVIAIGTTTTRALESAADEHGVIKTFTGETSLTITPGYKFRVVDALVTNFHLPRSSLLLLVVAFAGRDFVLSAYRHAVIERYRFYSYGDCMVII